MPPQTHAWPPSAQVAGLLLLVLLLGVLLTGHGNASGGSIAISSDVADARPALPRALVASYRRAVAVAGRSPGRVAFALALPGGRIVGEHMDETFPSASLSKSLLAVALLRSPLSHDRAALDDGARMIRWSDNDAATRTLARIGTARVREAAAAAGLRDFAIGKHWSESRASAHDFARLMLRWPALLPAAQRIRLHRWLGHVVPAQSWGIPEVLRPRGARVYLKGGWRGDLVHQAARIEWNGRVAGLAVLTSDQPDGLQTAVPTIRRITAGLLSAGPQALTNP